MSDNQPAELLHAERLAVVDRIAGGLDPNALSWVSGYLAGLARARSGDTADELVAEPRSETNCRATILYASQTGNGRRLAERFARTAEASGLAVRVLNMADYPARELPSERLLFVVVSTHGDGDPPDDARALTTLLLGKRAPRLERLGFSVLALGDSSYPRYCETGRWLDARLEQLGARRVAPRQNCDVDYEETAGAWITRSIEVVREQLSELGAPRLALVTSLRPGIALATRDRPAEIEVLANQRITGRRSARDVRHIELAAPADCLIYEPGDSLGVLHSNPPESVARVLELTRLDGTTIVVNDGRELPLAAWLQGEREITRLSRPFIESHARRAGDRRLDAALAPDGTPQLRHILRDFQVADLLRDHPADWSATELVAALRSLTPRLYSIASSRRAVGEEVHLTVAVVDYERSGERRYGAASRFLAALSPDAATLRAFIEPNPRFRVPKDGARDVIMIGPGTGVAPFRGFVQERAENGAQGRNWLFFGARHLDSEFLYQAEWLAALKRGTLHRLDAAFSRDQSQRIYVQQRMREHGAELFRWLENGAYIYVCGDAQQMAHDVHEALIDIVRVHGAIDQQAADAYVNALLAERRYARDVY